MTRDIRDDTHFRVLRILEQRPGISQRELAREMGMALGKANFLLVDLVKTGLIRTQPLRSAPGARRYAYILTPAGQATKAALLDGFLGRRMAEYDALRSEIESLQTERGRLQKGAQKKGQRGGTIPPGSGPPASAPRGSAERRG